MQEPTQFSLLSEHQPFNCSLQFLKSRVQQGVPDEVGAFVVGAVGATFGAGVGATIGDRVVGVVGPDGVTETSAQLKNCSGVVVFLDPSGLYGGMQAPRPFVQ